MRISSCSQKKTLTNLSVWIDGAVPYFGVAVAAKLCLSPTDGSLRESKDYAVALSLVQEELFFMKQDARNAQLAATVAMYLKFLDLGDQGTAGSDRYFLRC